MTDTRELALETFNEHALAGLAVGVVRDGELAETVSLGLADVAARKPVDADTVFRIGSISKTMTALAVMQLVEEGRIGLDDPVNERLRGYAVRHRDPSTPAVTVRHLLTHTSGLGELRRWSDLLRPTIGLGVKEGQPQPGLAEYYAPVLRAELPPGVKWAYANHGFATLGQLVADVSGRPFADHMRERLFEPLGMSGTDFLRTEGVRGGLAVGYQMKGKGLKPVKDREIAVAPAGSVFSTVREMALYVAALTGGGANEHGRAVSAETLVLMLTPQYEPDPRLASVGLSFMLERFGRHRVAGHDGGWPGFVSSMLIAPDVGLGVLAFTNTVTLIATHQLAGRLLLRLLGEDERDHSLPRPGIAESPWLWSELTGVYRPGSGLNTNARLVGLGLGEAEVLVKDGGLTLRALSTLPLLRRGARLYPVDAEDPLLFSAGGSGFSVGLLFVRGAGGAVERLEVASPVGYATLYRRRRPSLRTFGGAGAGALAAALALRRRRRRASFRP